MMQIPKVIHFFWFGGNPKPDIVKKCIKSWKRFMPDWTIKEWNESNYDVNKDLYIRQAYEAKKWAFVSDYARFDILNQYGGLYFDTDVELIRRIPDKLFGTAFTSMNDQGVVSPGSVFACPKGYWLTEKMMDSYHKSEFINKSQLNSDDTVNTRITNILLNYNYELKNKTQKIKDLIVYRADVFEGFDLNLRETVITKRTITVHHYASSWMTKKQLRKRKLQSAIKKVIGVKGYSCVIRIKRKLFGISKT